MEVELGLKITKTKHDFTSTSQLQFSKRSSGPVFLSRETTNLFILIAHLKGFEKDQIVIRINDEGTQITISAEKAVQEMTMVGWIMQEKEVELKGFIKTFQIPDGVDLDKIKAKFDEQDAILRIIMPKYVKGICGVGIEEVKEEEIDRSWPQMTQIASKEATKSVEKMEETDRIYQRREDKKEAKIGIEAEEFRKEKVEEGTIGKMEESQTVKEEVDKGELEITQSVTDNLSKREEDSERKGKAEQLEHSTFLNQETQRKELPDMEQQKLINDGSFTSKQEDEDEERKRKEEFDRLESEILHGLEAIAGSKETQSDHVPEKLKSSHLEDQNGEQDKEAGQEEGTRETENENKAAPKKEVEQSEEKEACSRQPVEEQKVSMMGEIKEKKPRAPIKVKLCTPCLIASSTIIVSIVVFAVHWIRSKRREAR